MKYLTDDGKLHWMVCHCGQEVDWIEERPGWKIFRCRAGHDNGWSADGGELDLGIVRDPDTTPKDYVIYGDP